MRLLVTLLLSIGFLHAQTSQRSIAAGTASTRVPVTVASRPEAGDRFVVVVATIKIRVVLVTPDGRNIDQANAPAAGMEWSEDPLTPPLGSLDGGYTIVIQFDAAGSAGRYTFNFNAKDATSLSAVRVDFVSETRVSSDAIRSLRGYKAVGPIAVKPGHASALSFALQREEPGAVFDVVFTDPLAKITLILPGGRVIDSPQGNQNGVEWETVQKPSDLDGDPVVSLTAFMLHRDGAHRVYTIESAVAGRYEIRAETTRGGPSEVTAAFIPMGRALEGASDTIDQLGVAGAGEVGLQMYALKSDCYVGDSLDLLVGLTGDPVAQPVIFKVRLEYRLTLGQDAKGEIRWGDPIVESSGITLTRNDDGRYAGKIVPMRPGRLRIGVSASGKRLNGKPFSDEQVLGEIYVKPVVGR